MKLEDFEGDRCAWCREPFEARAINHIFCCAKCEIAARVQRDRPPVLTMTCPCGTQFQTRRSFQKYCCHECCRKRNRKFNLEVISEERRQARSGRTCAHCGKACAFPALLQPCVRRGGRRCHDCGGSIPDAIRTDRLYCRACQRKRKRRELEKMLAKKPLVRPLALNPQPAK